MSVPSVAHLDLGGAVRQLRSHRRWLCALPRDPPVAKARSRGARLFALVHDCDLSRLGSEWAQLRRPGDLMPL